ncbi:MAG TPA: RidA family protein [Abditibacterium sp.]|jgi:enamine deaminase RidA (YjgF/YER057c/UK114 family)
MRQNFSSGSSWEPIIGYSRVVRVGSHVFVAGTTASGDNGVVGAGDAGAQTRYILEKIGKALEGAGASLKDVVRTRIFVRDISQWEAVGRAHGEFFGEILPVTAMVEVSNLIGDEYLVEIEADAIVSG